MYSEVVLDHFHNPRNVGTLESPDAIGSDGVRGQGNYLVLQLRLNGERISEAAFQTYGCPAAIGCGSYVSEWLKGRTMSEAEQLAWEEVTRALDLPLGKEHCAQLAVNALREALGQLSSREGEKP
jgi:nitrogen fixation NifU-like protein